MSEPKVIRTIKELRAVVQDWRQQSQTVGLVPTMGALHHGHLSLVDSIAKECDKIIVSIFVNPTQFGENEDFGSYPRDEAHDLEKLARYSVDLVFAPTAAEMYPKGVFTSLTKVHVAGLADILEGANRPGHFDGMATVVTKLLLQAQPDVAIFGEKDYQQLAVIRRLVADLNIPTKILGGELIREADGLAASSRNAYLNPMERKVAGQFNVILNRLVEAAQSGHCDLRQLERTASQQLLDAGFNAVDYVSIVDKRTLRPLDHIDQDAQVLAAVRIRDVRLLDNMAISPAL